MPLFAIEAQWDDRALVERDDMHVHRIDIVYVRSGTCPLRGVLAGSDYRKDNRRDG